MNQDLSNVILQNMMETENHFRQNKRKGSSGLVFDLKKIAESLQMPLEQVRPMMQNLVNARKIHVVSRDHYSLGDNPWGGQRRQKIFRCQHCGKPNEVYITGD